MLYTDIMKEYGEQWMQFDIDLPLLISRKLHLEVSCYKDSFVNIILIFDYERHDPNFSETKILEMQNYFTDAADMGKLYINYPMIESYLHLQSLPDTNYAERKIPVCLQPGKQYKELVRKESAVSHLIAFPHKIESLLMDHFGIQDELVRKQCFDSIVGCYSEEKIKDNLQKLLHQVISEELMQTAICQFAAMRIKVQEDCGCQTYWEYMRSVFQKIIYHNICKANKIQTGQYEVNGSTYRNCFEQIDLEKILRIQNESSREEQNGFIWVLNTCVFFIAEYNFSLVC